MANGELPAARSRKPQPQRRRSKFNIQRSTFKIGLRTPPFHRLVYRVVRQVPRGKVVTYGQVAAILGRPRAARAVGQALRMLPPVLLRVVPWQRVINAAGRISYRGDVFRPDLQRELLEAEGLRFQRGAVDLKRARWTGPKREWVTKLRGDFEF
jgi:methylated-DNA-protein-cysteine methyltransferase-like protein